jgi:hypothetical protein
VPAKALTAGFAFRHRYLREAVQDLLGSTGAHRRRCLVKHAP